MRDTAMSIKSLKHRIRNVPIVGPILASSYVWLARRRFSGSADYWESRYSSGGNSGDGSYGALAKFKAEILNGLVSEYGIETVIEFGCGDGHQLTLAEYPRYLGLDVSAKAVDICREKFRDDPGKTFALMRDYDGKQADAALSLDVLFHLVEDDVFENYMQTLFSAGKKLVVIYASNTDVQDIPQPPHVRHRAFSAWVDEHQRNWMLDREIENRIPFDAESGLGSPARFFVYVPAT